MMFAFILVLSLFLLVANACYITNCPQRIKSEDSVSRYCRTCANGLGMCFGPRICCGPDIGCLVDTKVSQVCEIEDSRYSTPCLPFGKPCSQLRFGKCATKNLCCSPESCVFDETCNEQNIIKFMDVEEVQKTVGLGERSKIKEKLKLALKHLLHNTKQKRIEFTD